MLHNSGEKKCIGDLYESAQRDAAAAAREDCHTFSVRTFMGRLLNSKRYKVIG